MIYSQDQQDFANRLTDDESTKHRHWGDWRWHIRHSIRDLATVESALDVELDEGFKREASRSLERFPMSITPYYLSLVNTEGNVLEDPVFQQAVPRGGSELLKHDSEMADPLSEEHDSPVPYLTHRYPDRVLFHISNVCSMYCRHCTRKRKVGDAESVPGRDELQAAIDYIRNTPQVRDVLLSGGDPLMLADDQLEWVLKEIRAIEHVEIIRIGTRMPVVLPYRVTDELVEMLKKYQPLWINTHFNHPREMTVSARTALSKLADAGIPLGNQTVLLAGINDCPRIMRSLNHKLLINRVRPYYLFQCDLSEGLSHLRTPVGKGVEIIESLQGHTSGMAVPTYVIDAPSGGGKIPIMPNYLISWSTHKVVLRNFEGVITTYREPDSYEPTFCDRNCAGCSLDLQLDSADEYRSVGICRLLDDYDKTISLTPEGNERHERREDG